MSSNRPVVLKAIKTACIDTGNIISSEGQVTIIDGSKKTLYTSESQKNPQSSSVCEDKKTPSTHSKVLSDLGNNTNKTTNDKSKISFTDQLNKDKEKTSISASGSIKIQATGEFVVGDIKTKGAINISVTDSEDDVDEPKASNILGR